MIDIKAIHGECYKAIDGENSDAVKTYLEQKNSNLTREVFFDRALWGILVAGFSRKGADTIKARALDRCGFPRPPEWRSLVEWDQARFEQFASCMRRGGHGFHTSKWNAIMSLANWLDKLRSEQEFQQQLFNGKSTGDELTDDDVVRLRRFNLPWIKDATSQYVIRMLGHEVIKDDAHVQHFCRWGGLNYEELSRVVGVAGVQKGLWDAVYWKYCELHDLRGYEQHMDHFNERFAQFRS